MSNFESCCSLDRTLIAHGKVWGSHSETQKWRKKKRYALFLCLFYEEHLQHFPSALEWNIFLNDCDNGINICQSK